MIIIDSFVQFPAHAVWTSQWEDRSASEIPHIILTICHLGLLVKCSFWFQKCGQGLRACISARPKRWWCEHLTYFCPFPNLFLFQYSFLCVDLPSKIWWEHGQGWWIKGYINRFRFLSVYSHSALSLVRPLLPHCLLSPRVSLITSPCVFGILFLCHFSNLGDWATLWSPDHWKLKTQTSLVRHSSPSYFLATTLTSFCLWEGLTGRGNEVSFVYSWELGLHAQLLWLEQQQVRVVKCRGLELKHQSYTWFSHVF